MKPSKFQLLQKTLLLVLILGLVGFAANSIIEMDDIIYVTSGNNAGLTSFDFDDENLSKKIGYLDIPDARWVDADDDTLSF